MRHLAPRLAARSPFALRRCRWLVLIFFATLAVLPAAHLRAAPTSIAQDGDGWVTREVQGVGESLVKAKADAIRAALRQAVGEFVRSELIVDGEAVEEFLIAFSTPEQVRSEQVGTPSLRPDGSIEVLMRVSIKSRSLVRAFELHASGSGGRVTRTATASAPSLQAARAAAITDGLRLIAGEFVDSKLVSDDSIVDEVIRSFTTGDSVQSEQVGEASLTPSGEVEVTMRISLRPQELIDMFTERSQGDILLDAETLAAEIEVARSSMQAQRTLMQRLFTDLPIRLLVARIVDREGRPIEDARPDPRDMRPVDDENIAIAFNVEIYFDLPSYYGTVLPNLVTALRAVSLDEQEGTWNFRPAVAAGVTGQYLFRSVDQRNPPAKQLLGSRAPVFDWPWEIFHNASQGTTLSPQERIVALSIGRNRDGSSEQWGLWRCPDWLAETVHVAAGSVLDVNLALTLLDDERRVVGSTVMPLSQANPLIVAGPHRTDGGVYVPKRRLSWDEAADVFTFEWRASPSIPRGLFEINGADPGTNVRAWFMNEWGIEAPWSRPMTFCSPRFCADLRGGSVIDILPVRLAMVLPQSDFERVRSIAFDFFTEAHLKAGAMQAGNNDARSGSGVTSDGGSPGVPGRRMPGSPIAPQRGPLGR